MAAEMPDVQYARSGDVAIAYQVVGEGPLDIVFVRGTLADLLAAFDGPRRAIECALAIREALRALGLEIRAGLHTGECERMDGKLGGIAVPTGARVASLAAPGEVLVSQTVRDLVAGSEIAFDERGVHELKGVPGAWRLYAVLDA
jgi:class 3 adenylate cyclase